MTIIERSMSQALHAYQYTSSLFEIQYNRVAVSKDVFLRNKDTKKKTFCRAFLIKFINKDLKNYV